MPLTPFEPKCYQPAAQHAQCQAGHAVHLDVGNYDQPMWVHCLLVDLVECPHDSEPVLDVAGYTGKHRAS